MTYTPPTIAMSAAFKTPRGAEIVLKIISERENIADHNFRSDCWDLVVSVNGQDRTLSPNRIDHPVHGPMLSMQEIGAPIPADALAAVDAVFAAYHARIDADFDARLAQDRRFASHNRLVRDMDRPDSNN